MHHRLAGSLTILAALAAYTGCASTQPPPELVDARVAYARAAAGDATQLSPAALHDAKVALDSAEHSFSKDSDSDMTRDRAYVATRKAELAEVVAATALAKRDESQTQAQSEAEKDQAARAARGELVQAREQLATTEQKLQTTDQNLETEKKARADAEKKARDALDKLSVANALAVKDEPRGTVITVPSGVLFASGKSDLLAGAQAKLDPVAEALSHEDDHKIIIEGHTDSQGSDASNMELSQRRAQTVRDYFSSRGVPADHITATGVGESRPIADNATAEGRANNRRVEIVIQPIEKR
jgi:outer membrane protein OmpA-like peptidoglycan-associated protein